MSSAPVPLTSFIGRKKEQVELTDLVRQYRLVTVTGPGGAGKSRLAARVAAEVAQDLSDGECWVDLGPLTSGELVADAVLAALGVADSSDHGGVERLSAFLTKRSVLVVLDNCEHLLDACAALVDSVLRAAPRTRVLATSREGLGVQGEVAWQVPPLSLPEADVDVPVENLGSYEAVQLFLDRALLARPGFAVTDETAPVVAEICARLDGIPLAIELAAVRVLVLSPRQILDGLADRFRLPSCGNRTGPERQRTLEASVAWSHDALTDRERVLFRRLSVFHGGFTLAGAAAVWTGSGDCPDGTDVLEIVDSLVTKSLVVVDAGEVNVRYRMLETLRQFAAARLDQAGEASAIRDAHTAFCVELAVDERDRPCPAPSACRSRQHASSSRLGGRQGGRGLGVGNCVRAHMAAQPARPVPPSVRERRADHVAATDGRVVARPRSGVVDGRDSAVVARRSGRGTQDRRRGPDPGGRSRRRGTAGLRGEHGHLGRDVLRPVAAAATLEAGLPLAETCGDTWLLMNITCDHLLLAMRGDDLANGRIRVARARAAASAAGNAYFLAWSLPAQAFLALRAGALDEARAAADRETALAEDLGDPWQHAPAALTLARILSARGDEAGAAAQIESARRSGHRLDSHWVAALADHAAGVLAAAGGEPARAADFQHAALARALAHGYRLLVLDCVEALADLALATPGDGPLEGVRLWAAARRCRDELGYRFRWEDPREALVAVRTRLGDDSYAAAWSAGAAMGLDDAATYATRGRGARRRPTTGWASLTPTELEVGRLAAVGLTNAEIGERLFMALGTVKVHLSRCFAKLGVANRVQLAVEARLLAAILADAATAGRSPFEMERAAVGLVRWHGEPLGPDQPCIAPDSSDDGQLQALT